MLHRNKFFTTFSPNRLHKLMTEISVVVHINLDLKREGGGYRCDLTLQVLA